MATSALKKKKTKSAFNNFFFFSGTNFFPLLYFFFFFFFWKPTASQKLKNMYESFVLFFFFHLSQWLIFCSKPRSTKPLPFISIESTTSSSTIPWSKSLTFSLTKIHPFSVKTDLCESPNRQIPSIWRWKALIRSTTWRPRSKMK